MRASLIALALLVGGGSVAFADDPMPSETAAPKAEVAPKAAPKAEASKAEADKPTADKPAKGKHHKKQARKKPAAKKHHKHHAKKQK